MPKRSSPRRSSGRPVLHLICQAHLDPVWLWPLRDGIAETLTTMRSAVDRAAEIPEFQFTRSSAWTYRWAQECDPALFKQVARLVRAGRWETIGGWLEQPDCNLPSAESLMRQALLAKRFFAEAFSEAGETRIGYNVDSFGHSGGLPQVLKQCGLDYYVFMRPDANDNPAVPLLFWWEGPDDSRVLAQKIPIQYSQSYSASPDAIEAVARESATKGFAPGFRHGLMFFGVGNHGGGPTRAHLARMRQLQADPNFPVEIRFSTMRQYFAAIEGEPAFRSLPVWKNELNFIFRGCYAATGEVKQQHRAAEKALYAAEALAVLDRGAKAPAGELDESWWRYGLNQFHDILAGTCVASTQEENRSRFGSVLNQAREVALRSAASIARRVDTSKEPRSVVFAANPLPWPRLALVQLDTFITPHGQERITHLETAEGERIPIQWMRADANFGPWGIPWGKLTAVVPLPAAGYQVFRAATEPLEQRLGNPFAQNEATSEQFAAPAQPQQASGLGPIKPEPALASLPVASIAGNRRSSLEALAAPVGFIAIADNSSAWGHGVASYASDLGRPESLGSRVLESGELVSITREKFRWDRSEIWLDVVRLVHSPLVELRVRFNWQQRRQLLKLEIPTRLKPTASHAKSCGSVTRRVVRGLEEPCHDWVALEGSIGRQPATVALLNDSSYSFDVHGGSLRMILARGVPHAEHPPFEYPPDLAEELPFLDQGWQERRFWLLVDARPWDQLGLDRLAQECQIPAAALLDSAHPGSEPWSKSSLSVEPGNVAVLALKRAARGPGFLLRLQEMAGRPTEARLAWEGTKFKAKLNPWEIRSLLLLPDPAKGWRLAKTDALETNNPPHLSVQR
jgi:alpha-mannosidase